MCSEQGLAEDRVGTSDLERVREGDNEVSITKVLSAVYDEYRYNNIFLIFDCQLLSRFSLKSIALQALLKTSCFV